MKSVKGSPVEFDVKAKSVVDVVVRKHDYAVGSHTGWHSHPGPVFITVTEGTLTYYLYDDPTCTPHTVTKGSGFVDDGRGHMVRNESGQPAQDIERDHRAAGPGAVPRRARRSKSELRLLRATRRFEVDLSRKLSIAKVRWWKEKV